MKIPNKIIQSLLSFCLRIDEIASVKQQIESTRDQEFAAIKEIKPLSFYEPLAHPCYYQYGETSKLLSSDGSRIISYELSALDFYASKDPIFISLDKTSLTKSWMISVGDNRDSISLDAFIAAGKRLPSKNIFEIAIQDNLLTIEKLINHDFVEVNAQYLLDAVSASISASNKESPTIKICIESGKILLFQGEKIIGVIMGLS